MKKITTVLLSTAIATTTILAAPKTEFQIELGATNTKLGNYSETGTTVKLRNGKDSGFNAEFSHTSGDMLSINEFAGNYNWEISNKIYVGANLSVTGVNLNETTLQGITYGAQAKYLIAQNHGLLLGYKSGSVVDDTGLLTLDLDMTSLVYSYRF